MNNLPVRLSQLMKWEDNTKFVNLLTPDRGTGLFSPPITRPRLIGNLLSGQIIVSRISNNFEIVVKLKLGIPKLKTQLQCEFYLFNQLYEVTICRA